LRSLSNETTDDVVNESRIAVNDGGIVEVVCHRVSRQDSTGIVEIHGALNEGVAHPEGRSGELVAYRSTGVIGKV